MESNKKNVFKRILFRLLGSISQIVFPNKLRIFLNKLRGVKIGQNSFIGKNVYIDDNAPFLVSIGNNVGIARGTIVLTHRRNIKEYTSEKGYNDYPFITDKVIIEDNCQIGVNVVILPGVTIGKASIIGAGAVVNKSIPPLSLAVGVPAKVIKNF